ncbi:MAG: hypothetical protein ACE5GS_06700 [Kiloniellaceae bacterium]
MAATVIVNEYNGAAPGTKTNKTSGTVRFKNADDANVDLNDPLVVPSAGQEYSFEKWLRLQIAGGTFTQISNLRAYSDGANNFGAGIKAWYAVSGVYMQPVVPDEAADPPQSAAAGSPVENMADLFTATQASPIDLDGINVGPFTDGSPAEEIGDFLVLVLEVEPAASQGVLAAETLTFAYDEI